MSENDHVHLNKCKIGNQTNCKTFNVFKKETISSFI